MIRSAGFWATRSADAVQNDGLLGNSSAGATMTLKQTRGVFLAAVVLGLSAPVQALEFQLGEHSLKVDSLITVGGVMRMQDRDHSLIAKANLARLQGMPNPCVQRTGDDGVSGPDLSGDNVFTGNTCTTSNGTTPGTPSTANIDYVALPGSYAINSDNGNLNFDKHDLVQATAKITTDVTANLFGFNVFVRGLYYFDDVYTKLEEVHPDTTLQPRFSQYPDKNKDVNGQDAQLLDYFISRSFEFADRQFAFKLGNQVLNWGESAFLIPNSLNSINPPNQALLRLPGFDIKELFQPVGMAYLSAEVMSSVNFEAFYQYEFKSVVADPVGSFFSQSDILGEGGKYAMLSFGKAPEDPLNLYQPNQNGDDPIGTLGSTAGRTIYRDLAEEARRAPKDGGQYGAAIKYFADWLNGGTEFGLYFANYHSRFPTVSFTAARTPTCIGPDMGSPGANLASFLVSCDALPAGANIGTYIGSLLSGEARLAPNEEPVPVDTASLFIEYPEDIRMYGFSFNTTLGDWAFAGEYAYRDNLPIQINTVDLTLTAVSPAFPDDNFNVGVATIPGHRAATATFTPVYRNVRRRNDGDAFGYAAGDYIRGYERMKQGQIDVTLLKTIGGDNPIGATQITLVFEFGHTYVFDFPELSEIQFNGAGTDTHPSVGADGTTGINPVDLRLNPNDPTSVDPDLSQPGLRQNPTAHQDLGGFGTQQSYGYRAVALSRYDNAFLGVNLEFLTGFFHDVEGVGPGIGQNFVEGRKQSLFGIRGDYLSKYTGEIRYTWFSGGKLRDQLRDRDNLLVFLGYQF